MHSNICCLECAFPIETATDFYEQGWGQSFHFAPRGPGETFRESIVRHEHYIALRLGIQPDDVVLDIGYSPFM